ncbi:hypothetical protein L2D01_14290 [Hyphomonadaceae bacterium ML37]|nr:hypothetical protein L2D01_14290 [Hyphomonadaceae bacterium ML37]
MSGRTKPNGDPEPVDAEFKPVDSEPEPRKGLSRALAILRLTGFVVAAALIGGAAGWVLVRAMPAPAPDLTALEARLGALETAEIPPPDLSRIETRLSALETEDPGEALRGQALEQLVRDAAALRDRVDSLEAVEPPEGTDLTGLETRIDETASDAARRLDALEARIAALGSGEAGEGVDVSAALDPVLTRLDALTDRIAAAERANDEAARLQSRLDAATGRLDDLDARLAEVEAAPDAAPPSPDGARRALAYADLASAARGSAPFAVELAELRRAWPDAPAMGDLRAHARTGAPSREQLAAQLPDDELQAVSAQTEVWFGVLRIARNTQGPGPGDAIRAALDDGDLEGAVADARALEDPARAVIADWLQGAEARLQVEAALSQVRAALDDEVAP